jgi:hypothetical protein
MKRIIVCLLVMLLFAGCAQQAAEDTTKATTETKTTATETTKDEIKPESTVLTDEILDTLNEQLKPGVKSTDLIPNHVKLKYGDQAVFGVGIQNIQNAEDIFFIKVTFDKAYDKYMNTIDTDEETMNDWVTTVLKEFTLAPSEKKIVSVVIEVGDTNSGVKPQPGTYQFDVETLYKRGGYYANKEYIGRREFSIRVEQ